MAQSVKCLTLDFCSGHDLSVCGIEPYTGLCTDSAEPALDSLSPPSLPLSFSLCPPPLVLLLKYQLTLKEKKECTLKITYLCMHMCIEKRLKEYILKCKWNLIGGIVSDFILFLTILYILIFVFTRVRIYFGVQEK